MKIGIVTALPEETRAVLRNVPQPERSRHQGLPTWHGSPGGRGIVLIESGMGMRNAGRAAELLVLAERPGLLVSAGLGGGVRPGLSVGDVVMAERLLLCAAGCFEAVRMAPAPAMTAAGILRGTFVTTDGILNKQRLAELLPADTPHPVVEMESAAIARVADSHAIPFLGIRAISDAWDEELGFAIDEFCDDQMRIRPVKVLATILRRPRIIPQLIRLAAGSRVAAARLAEAIGLLLQQP